MIRKIILLIAVITVTAHSIFPHMHLHEIMDIVNNHHHDEQPVETQHSHDADHKDNHQNIFSFAQLDDDFIPANGQPKNFETRSAYLHAIIPAYLPGINPVNTKPHWGWYIEYPPPDDYRYNLPSRAPPAVV